MKSTTFTLLCFILILSTSCENDEGFNTPTGVKWYDEYLEDSVLLHQQYTTGNIVVEKYFWENNGFLNSGGTTYKCIFYEDTMQLDYVHANAIFMSRFFKRIK